MSGEKQCYVQAEGWAGLLLLAGLQASSNQAKEAGGALCSSTPQSLVLAGEFCYMGFSVFRD
jgi:hypothetical protein